MGRGRQRCRFGWHALRYSEGRGEPEATSAHAHDQGEVYGFGALSGWQVRFPGASSRPSEYLRACHPTLPVRSCSVDAVRLNYHRRCFFSERFKRWLLILTLMFACRGTGRAVPRQGEIDDQPDYAPVVGRPEHFSGAIGAFRVTTRAEPVELQAEDPLTFTVRITAITASGPVRQAPERPDLRNFTAFANSFYLAGATEEDVRHPNKNTWEFDYHLRPRNSHVDAVPSFPFVFFRPNIFPPTLGYQTIYTPTVPLRVAPRAVVKSTDVRGGPPLRPAPDFIYEAATGDAVLRDQSLGALPGPVLLLFLFVLPPLCGAIWYWAWRRLYPDAARRAKRWRSRATRYALHALTQVAKGSAVDEGGQTAAIVSQYLRHRLDLVMEEPTPAEVGSHLRGREMPFPLVEQTEQFFRACDKARFIPASRDEGEDLTVAATKLILALEEEL